MPNTSNTNISALKYQPGVIPHVDCILGGCLGWTFWLMGWASWVGGRDHMQPYSSASRSPIQTLSSPDAVKFRTLLIMQSDRR